MRYGELTAVDTVSFVVRPAEVVALLGPNGAGKTTTVETLEGYIAPTAGSVRVLGCDPRTDAAALHPRIGVMLQGGGVHSAARPMELLTLFASYYDHPRPPAELLAEVGLADRTTTPWKQLSGGEQQRLSLALALVGQPEVVFLDEPTAGVDVGGRRSIRALISSLKTRGVAVLLTTHDMEEVSELADRVLIIDHGALITSGTPDELTRTTSVGITFHAPAGLDLADLRNALGAPVAEGEPGVYRLDAAPEPATVATLTGWLADHDLPLELRSGRERLEDVFMRLTSENQPSDNPEGDDQPGRGGRRRRSERGRR